MAACGASRGLAAPHRRSRLAAGVRCRPCPRAHSLPTAHLPARSRRVRGHRPAAALPARGARGRRDRRRAAAARARPGDHVRHAAPSRRRSRTRAPPTSRWCRSSAGQGDVPRPRPGGGVPDLRPRRRRRRRASELVWRLEAAIIDALEAHGLDAGRAPGYPGVWVDAARRRAPRKIASVGLRLTRGVTFHGIARQRRLRPRRRSAGSRRAASPTRDDEPRPRARVEDDAAERLASARAQRRAAPRRAGSPSASDRSPPTVGVDDLRARRRAIHRRPIRSCRCPASRAGVAPRADSTWQRVPSMTDERRHRARARAGSRGRARRPHPRAHGARPGDPGAAAAMHAQRSPSVRARATGRRCA